MWLALSRHMSRDCHRQRLCRKLNPKCADGQPMSWTPGRIWINSSVWHWNEHILAWYQHLLTWYQHLLTWYQHLLTWSISKILAALCNINDSVSCPAQQHVCIRLFVCVWSVGMLHACWSWGTAIFQINGISNNMLEMTCYSLVFVAVLVFSGRFGELTAIGCLTHNWGLAPEKD